jgi:hypothetical protein
MRWKHIGIIFGAVLVIAFFAYSIREYQKTGAKSEGLVTCAKGQCFWTAHIHTWVRINICGKDKELPEFVGPLSSIHTHAGKNILHWHDKLMIDPETREFRDTRVLTIGFGLETLSIPFMTDGIMEEKNGDLCPDGSIGSLKFFVNGAPLPPNPFYAWKNRDIIDIIFDDRTEAQTRRYVETLPQTFPSFIND